MCECARPAASEQAYANQLKEALSACCCCYCSREPVKPNDAESAHAHTLDGHRDVASTRTEAKPRAGPHCDAGVPLGASESENCRFHLISAHRDGHGGGGGGGCEAPAPRCAGAARAYVRRHARARKLVSNQIRRVRPQAFPSTTASRSLSLSLSHLSIVRVSAWIRARARSSTL